MMLLQTRVSAGIARPRASVQTRRAVATSAMPDRTLHTALAGACASLLLAAQPATAAGIESIDLLPESIETPSVFAGMAQEQKSKLDAADEV